MSSILRGVVATCTHPGSKTLHTFYRARTLRARLCPRLIDVGNAAARA